MRNLIDFALTGPDPSEIRFLFISSVASCMNWKNEDGPLPERPITDSRVALGLGYGAGKYVAESVRFPYVILAPSSLTISVTREEWLEIDVYPDNTGRRKFHHGNLVNNGMVSYDG